MSPYSWREATLEDIDTLVRHRREMFAELGYRDNLEGVARAADAWFRHTIPAGIYHAWLATAPDGTIAAGGGISIVAWPPGPLDLGERAAYMYNVYTEPAHRRRGLARELMTSIHEWCRREGIHSVRLHASDAVRGLCTAMGYKPANEMRIVLTAGSGR